MFFSIQCDAELSEVQDLMVHCKFVTYGMNELDFCIFSAGKLFNCSSGIWLFHLHLDFEEFLFIFLALMQTSFFGFVIEVNGAECSGPRMAMPQVTLQKRVILKTPELL